jgi:4'-phosphopantetheinyl transferase
VSTISIDALGGYLAEAAADGDGVRQLVPAWRPLNLGEIHVWRVELGALEGDSATEGLARDPRGRARALKRGSQSAVRAVLSAYLGCGADDVRFELGAFGKPSLASPHRGDIHFNLSRSCGRCLIAVGRSAPVGVDLERVRPIGDLDRMAERVLAPAEAFAIRSEQGDAKLRVFYKCWTRKEAYAKAIGLGLALPFDEFCVSVAERAAPAVLTLVDDDPGAWTLWALEPWPGYVGAVATRQPLSETVVSMRTFGGSD